MDLSRLGLTKGLTLPLIEIAGMDVKSKGPSISDIGKFLTPTPLRWFQLPLANFTNFFTAPPPPTNA